MPTRSAVCPFVIASVVLLAGCRSDEGPHARPLADAAAAGTAGAVRVLSRGTLGAEGVDTRAAAFADFDGDGRQDLALACFKAPNVVLLAGVDGGYRPTETGSLGAVSDRSFDVSAGDLDGDGDADLMVVNSNGEPNALHRNRGDGVFDAVTGGSIDAVGRDSYAGLLVDLDGDGDLDAVVVNRAAVNELHRNDGAGGMTLMEEGAFSEDAGNSRDVAAGDLDGDGDADLVVVRADGQSDELYLNQGGRQGGETGRFERERASELALSVGRSSGCALGDVDGDGDLDLAVVGRKGDPTRLYRNLGGGRLVLATGAIPAGDGGNSTACVFVDLDGVGGVDLLVANRQGPAHLFLNRGDGSFRRDDALDPAGAALESTGVAVRTLDTAGRVELLLTDAKAPATHLRLEVGTR